MNIEFGWKEFHDLDNDLKASNKAIPTIVAKVMREDFSRLRNEVRPQIPSKSGAIRRHFNFSVRRGLSRVTARLGFIAKTTQRTAIAANVMQHGSNVRPKKGVYLWIPLPGNRQASGEPVISPRQIFADRLSFFVGKSKAGNLLAFRKRSGGIDPLFVLKKWIKVKARPVQFEARVESNLPAMNERIEKTIAAVIEAKNAASRI